MRLPPRAAPLLGVLLLAGLFAASCARPGAPGRVEGGVTWEGQVVTSALVQAFLRPEQDPTTPPAGEAATGEDGRYVLELPPGRYWLWARAAVPGSGREVRLVGQAAGNPVTVPEGARVRADVALHDPSGFSRSAGPAGTGAEGEIEGAPPGEVTVYAYPGTWERPVGPGFAAAATPDEGGRFRLDLPPGAYTLAARHRASGRDFGAPAEGDAVASAPVEVRPGAYARAGTLFLRPVDPQVLRGRVPATPPTGTSISGRIVDARGGAAAGVRVLAFTDGRMSGKPAALSTPSRSDGAFVVHVPGAGAYFLGARSRLGGPAEPGERVGAFRGADGSGVRVAGDEERGGVTIVVEEVW